MKFSGELVRLICGASKRRYPDEFIALLRKNDEGIVGEVIILPNSVHGKGFASVDFNMLPITSEVCGSVHSHPSPNNRPSRGDLLFFARVRGCHAIVGFPFWEKDIAVYDEKGKPLMLEIV